MLDFHGLHQLMLDAFAQRKETSSRLHYGWPEALEEEFIHAQGPNCPDLLAHLQEHGDDYAAVMATLGNPFVAVLMLAFLGVSVWHMKIGMQVIIEDYVNQPLLRVLALMANSFFSALVGIASAAALLKITFGA